MAGGLLENVSKAPKHTLKLSEASIVRESKETKGETSSKLLEHYCSRLHHKHNELFEPEMKIRKFRIFVLVMFVANFKKSPLARHS